MGAQVAGLRGGQARGAGRERDSGLRPAPGADGRGAGGSRAAVPGSGFGREGPAEAASNQPSGRDSQLPITARPGRPRPAASFVPLALVALSAPSGPCDFWPARTRLCARACVQASPWPCTLMCPQLAQGPRERLAKAPEKLLGEDEL